jgi:hypothetical protein
MTFIAAAHGPLGHGAPGGRVECGCGVGLHVRIDPDYDHGRPFPRRASDGGDRRRTRLGWGLWPGSYQVTSTTPRFPAAEDRTAEGQPFRATEALRVTPPSGPRLPDRSQGSRGTRVTPRKRLFGEFSVQAEAA